MRTIEQIYLHTAAHASKGVPLDTTAKQIDSWHRDRGWTKIGYNYVIRFNGSIENGRSEDDIPAHVEGYNSRSIGICFSGNGDVAALTGSQMEAGVELVVRLLNKYNLVEEFKRQPLVVAGHREVNDWVDLKKADAKLKTTKTCPGKLVSMQQFRAKVLEKLDSAVPANYKYKKESAEKLFNALRSMYEACAEMSVDNDTVGLLNQFRKDSDISNIIDRYRNRTG
jgi:N-acetylmuramoyl-L-alanine amidase